jgi:hypothetical protein
MTTIKDFFLKVQFLEENTRGNLYITGLCKDFLNRTQKAQSIKEKYYRMCVGGVAQVVECMLCKHKFKLLYHQKKKKHKKYYRIDFNNLKTFAL